MERKNNKKQKQVVVTAPAQDASQQVIEPPVEIVPVVVTASTQDVSQEIVESPVEIVPVVVHAATVDPPSLESLQYKNEEPSQIEKAIETFASAQKPWFLSTRDIYQTVKTTAALIPKGREAFEMSLNGLEAVTDQINSHTRFHVAFDVNQSYELINKLDTVLADHLVAVDDGLDGLRGKLALQLRALITAVVTHKKWAEKLTQDTTQSTQQSVRSRFEQAMELLTSIVQYAEQRFPKATELVKQTSHQVVQGAEKGKELYSTISQQTVRGLALSSVGYLLQLAQPCVHKGVELAAPIWNQSICVARPVAKPVLDLAKQSAITVENKLASNSLVGKHVTNAHHLAISLVNNVANYAIPTSVEIVYL